MGSDLQQLISKLDAEQRGILKEMAKAMKAGLSERLYDKSDIMVPAFASHFRNRLLIHHACTDEKLTKKSFEYAFKHASVAAGRKSEITTSQTNPGSDVIVDGVNFSLKTEGAKKMSNHMIVISKFCEARFIRNYKTRKTLAAAAQERIAAHLAEYDRILTLRSSEQDSDYQYDLLEIPKSALEAISKMKVSDWGSKISKSGSLSGTVSTADGRTLLGVTLDGSVEKVSIRKLPVSACRWHGTWVVPKQ